MDVGNISEEHKGHQGDCGHSCDRGCPGELKGANGEENYGGYDQEVDYMGKGGNHMWWNTAKGKGTKGKGEGGKGKGKGKGCWTCGALDHHAAQCPKGAGKGCWTCGQRGCYAATCPKGKGKGKGL